MDVLLLTWQALRHDGEGDPGSDFVGVVGAGHQAEQASQRVCSRVGNLSHLGSGRAQVSQGNVDAKVAKLT